MIRTIYIIILAYFILGAAGFYFINRKKDLHEARKNWIKLFTYFLIINILFFSIIINPLVFRGLSVLIMITGLYELFKLFRQSGFNQKIFFLVSVLVFGLFSLGFFWFSGLEKGLILFSFLVLSIFDSFSQITGQLWGRRKILPGISPEKTAEGLIGGSLIAILTSLLIKGLITAPSFRTILLAAGVVVFAFIGDISTSYYKRRYHVKDFSTLIPGHGGILDRFDSLIAGGAWIAFSGFLFNF